MTQCRIRQNPVSQSHIYELNEMFEIIVICHVCFSSTKEKSWSFPGTTTRVKIHQVHYNKVIWNKVKSWLSGVWNSFASGDKNNFKVITRVSQEPVIGHLVFNLTSKFYRKVYYLKLQISADSFFANTNHVRGAR